MTSRKVKLRTGTKVKLHLKGKDDWKIIKTFNGLKFNDKEKKALWGIVKPLFSNPDGSRKSQRANLGSFIKETLWRAYLPDYKEFNDFESWEKAKG